MTKKATMKQLRKVSVLPASSRIQSTSGECLSAVLEWDNTAKLPSTFRAGATAPARSDCWQIPVRHTTSVMIDGNFTTSGRSTAIYKIQQLSGCCDHVAMTGTVLLYVDGDGGRQHMELHNVILKESLAHNIFSLQQARQQRLQYDIGGGKSEKIKLVNRLKDGTTFLFALMT